MYIVLDLNHVDDNCCSLSKHEQTLTAPFQILKGYLTVKC